MDRLHKGRVRLKVLEFSYFHKSIVMFTVFFQKDHMHLVKFFMNVLLTNLLKIGKIHPSWLLISLIIIQKNETLLLYKRIFMISFSF